MKKRWLLNVALFLLLAGLGAFIYFKPSTTVEGNAVYEVSDFKLADFVTISAEFPTKAATRFTKVNNFWMMTSPHKTRADQASVQRILSIIAATSQTKIPADDLEKFGLHQPSIKLRLTKKDNSEIEFLFGTHNPINDEQYVLHNNAIYLLPNRYAEAAETQIVELIDKSLLRPTEKVAGFDFSRLEQWEESRLNLDIKDGQWVASIKAAKPQQDELNEWLDFSWKNNPAKSVEFYTPNIRDKYPSFVIKMADGSRVQFDKILESPELVLARADEGLQYHFPSDAGFSMLNPPLNIASPEEKSKAPSNAK